MALIKAHIVLADDKANDSAARAQVLAEIRQNVNIYAYNEKRFEDFGLLSCVIDESELEKVRQVNGVEKVELDQEKYVSKKRRIMKK